MKQLTGRQQLFSALPALWLIWGCAVCPTIGAQQRPVSGKGSQAVVLAFYNTENFFDTLPDPAAQADPYTPSGSRRWTGERYRHKAENIARVLDTLRADIIGLAEIENETVLRDLLSAMRTDYNYILLSGGDSRGMNVALLYRGSVFFPLRTFQLKGPGLSRPVLAVKGRLGDDTLTVMIVHAPSLLNRTLWRKRAAQSLRERLDELRRREPSGKIVLMGDFNMSPGSTLARRELGIAPWPPEEKSIPSPDKAHCGTLHTPFFALERRGEGSYAYRDRRYLYDYMILGGAWSGPEGWQFRGRCGIFSPDFLLHGEGPARGYPRRTFEGSRYTQGFSDHLPVWLILEK